MAAEERQPQYPQSHGQWAKQEDSYHDTKVEAGEIVPPPRYDGQHARQNR
jgi:hypothetical protein